MPTNDFVTIAAGNGANTLTVAQYQASGKLALGWQDGIVDGPTFNTMWRQLSTVTTMIAQFIADNQSANVQDNGSVATLEAQFGAAMLAYVEKEGIVWCIDTGTADALTANPVPVVPSYAAGQVVAILKNPQVGANATATPSLNISSLGAKTIVKGSGAQLVAGDLVAASLTLAVYDGSQFRHIGAALSTTDLRVQAGQTVVFQAAGTNAYTGSLIPAPAALTPRMEVLGAFGNANTSSGAPTLQLNGLGNALPILKQGGGTPQPGDVSGFVPLILNSAGTAWLINGLAISDVLALIAANAPQIVTGNPTLYVSTSGSDSNPGTQAAPFLTPQAALNYAVQHFVTQGKVLTIQLAVAGTYPCPTVIPAAAGAISIMGDPNNQANYILSGAGQSGASGVIQAQGAIVSFSGLTISNTSSNIATVAALAGGAISLNKVTLAHTVASGAPDIIAYPGGSVAITGNITLAASCSCALYSLGGSISVNSNVVVALGNNNSYSSAVTQATNSGGSITFNSGSSITGTNISGSRYSITVNASINTYGGGASFIPGSTSGTTGSGGTYA